MRQNERNLTKLIQKLAYCKASYHTARRPIGALPGIPRGHPCVYIYIIEDLHFRCVHRKRKEPISIYNMSGYDRGYDNGGGQGGGGSSRDPYAPRDPYARDQDPYANQQQQQGYQQGDPYANQGQQGGYYQGGGGYSGGGDGYKRARDDYGGYDQDKRYRQDDRGGYGGSRGGGGYDDRYVRIYLSISI